ncbi:hypothetical protein TSAR_003956 [Trichomalopsis sarcophagae]|uniref:Uncharacterized protein n=1 Tax=Trichomalopsis sarcophagae TaxID=543379 RepID=A0A232ESI9_9HYME|nr:hypothetical protein TSAR_003956 [Trichomalopsis sarcophagae]
MNKESTRHCCVTEVSEPILIPHKVWRSAALTLYSFKALDVRSFEVALRLPSMQARFSSAKLSRGSLELEKPNRNVAGQKFLDDEKITSFNPPIAKQKYLYEYVKSQDYPSTEIDIRHKTTTPTPHLSAFDHIADSGAEQTTKKYEHVDF